MPTQPLTNVFYEAQCLLAHTFPTAPENIPHALLKLILFGAVVTILDEALDFFATFTAELSIQEKLQLLDDSFAFLG
jgi:hypothetical protein